MPTEPTGDAPKKPSPGANVIAVIVAIIAAIGGFLAAQALVKGCRSEAGVHREKPGPEDIEPPAKPQEDMLK